jgi:MoaA/NifB/PqqE/SkfB family radical SAM enzyme
VSIRGIRVIRVPWLFSGLRMALELISIELTNRCAKACWFCYNHSLPEGETRWEPAEVVAFVRDCAAHGIQAASFGGGEPLQ